MLQKFRADEAGSPYPNGAISWVTNWMGGRSLAKILNCPTPFGPRTVYIQSEPDTFFSQPAACRFRGWDIRGWISFDSNGPTFHASKFSKAFPHVDREAR